MHDQKNIKKLYDSVDCHIPVERVFVRHLNITSLRFVISHFTRKYACLRFQKYSSILKIFYSRISVYLNWTRSRFSSNDR